MFVTPYQCLVVGPVWILSRALCLVVDSDLICSQAPLVAAFSAGDITTWLQSRGYTTSKDEAKHMLTRWTESRVLEQVNGFIVTDSDNLFTQKQKTNSTDPEAFVYRFVDPWEVEALAPTATQCFPAH